NAWCIIGANYWCIIPCPMTQGILIKITYYINEMRRPYRKKVKIKCSLKRKNLKNGEILKM
ncbi:MAG: hypothetical protein CO162_06405, partial [bacterium (Candidatus Ratteibacteria) CG_4_9_14_3_um_filter_41_21]